MAGRRSGDYILTCSLNVEDLAHVKLLLEQAGFPYSVARSLKNVPDEVQPLFRFELFYNGTYQAAGLVQRLSDLCSQAEYRRLMKPFKDSLLVPVSLEQPCSFWFTENGLKKFADAIDEINRCISQTGWEVQGSALWVHEMNYLYVDEYQVALDPEFVNSENFIRFSSATELMVFEK